MRPVAAKPIALDGGDARPRPLPGRTLILGLLLVPLLCAAVVYGELVAWVGELVATSLMLVVTCALGLFLGLNVLLRRWRPGWRFSRAELLYLFVMLTAGGSIAGVGMTQFVVPMLSHIFHYATPGNRWEQFHPYVPMWLVPDLSVLEGFYRGETTFYTLAHIRGWLGPMIWWSVFMFAFVIFMLCMSLILRRQWVEKERLSFPIVYFPLELTRERSPLWRDRALWVGFLLPVVLQSLAGLNSLFPSVPYLPLKPSPQLNIGSFFGAGPLEPLSGVTLAFYPMAIGIGYFAQSEVLFSCWFFYWAARLSEVVCIVLGYRGPGAAPGLSDMPFLYQQSLGAYWALGAVALWLGRGEIAAAARQAFGLSREPAHDVGMYRAAFGGLTYPDHQWLDVFAGGPAGCGDAVLLHCFHESWGPPGVPIEDSLDSLYTDHFLPVVDRRAAGKPIWMSECGYSTLNRTEESQATFIARAVPHFLANTAGGHRITRFTYYETKDLAEGSAMIGDDHNYHFGLCRTDRTKKLAFHTYALLAKLLNGRAIAPADHEVTITATGGAFGKAYHHLLKRADGAQILFVYDKANSVTARAVLATPGATCTKWDLDGTRQMWREFDGTAISNIGLTPGEVWLFEIR